MYGKVRDKINIIINTKFLNCFYKVNRGIDKNQDSFYQQ